MNVERFLLGTFIFAVIERMWYFLMWPGRLIANAVGFGTSLIWTSVLILVISFGGILGKSVIHSARNAYIEAFVPDRVPVPLDLYYELGTGLSVVKSTRYMEPPRSTQGILSMTVTNNTKYPLSKIWFICKMHGRLYADSYSTVNTGYLFDGVMPPGQTRTAEIVFEGPSGGDYMSECELQGAKVPYGWWEGIPIEALEPEVGRGPGRLYDPERYGVVSEGTGERERVFLDGDLKPTTDPMDDVDQTPIWGDETRAPPPAVGPSVRNGVVMDYEGYVDSEGVLIEIEARNGGRSSIRNLPIVCLILSNGVVEDRRFSVFGGGLQPGDDGLESYLIRDIFQADAIACELGE